MSFKYEILAPVGNFDMLYAAISAGANAVYLAGPNFGARAYAENFTKEDLEKIVKEIHFHNMNVYITVNTVIKRKGIKKCTRFYKFYL